MTSTNEGSVGDCNDDHFSVTSGGNSGSPMICGTNTDQHCKIFDHNKTKLHCDKKIGYKLTIHRIWVSVHSQL